LPRENRWQALARAALRDDLQTQERLLTRDVLRQESPQSDADSRISAWTKRNSVAVDRCRQVLADLKGGPKADFAMLSVAMREIRSMHEDDEAPGEARAGRSAPESKKSSSKAKAKAKAKANGQTA